MSAYRTQAHIDAPLEDVWALAGNPATYPDWWPVAVEIRGERFEVGDLFTQVVGVAGRRLEYSRIIERREELKALNWRCPTTCGRNMFGPIRGEWGDEEWKGWWGDEPPYHSPVFVLTHHAHEPIEMQGGTTFHFVTEGPEAALERAREVAGSRDINIGGGASTAQQYLRLGLVDEMEIHVVPALLGAGERLFENSRRPAVVPQAARGPQLAARRPLPLRAGPIEARKRKRARSEKCARPATVLLAPRRRLNIGDPYAPGI